MAVALTTYSLTRRTAVGMAAPGRRGYNGGSSGVHELGASLQSRPARWSAAAAVQHPRPAFRAGQLRRRWRGGALASPERLDAVAAAAAQRGIAWPGQPLCRIQLLRAGARTHRYRFRRGPGRRAHRRRAPATRGGPIGSARRFRGDPLREALGAAQGMGTFSRSRDPDAFGAGA